MFTDADLYNRPQGGMIMAAATRRVNITLDPDVYERFIKIAEKKGMKVSTWINQRMKEFVEEEEKNLNSKGT